jgi:tetratricopeptide (TPR) repeat protein
MIPPPTLRRRGTLLAILWLGVWGIPLGCAGLPPDEGPAPDRALAEATAAGRDAFDQDRIEPAVTFYAIALNRARALDQPSAIGDAAYNLAACLLRQSRWDRARALLAEAEFEQTRCGAPLADVLLLEARAAHLAGDVAAAVAALGRLRTDPRSRPTDAHRVQASLLAGQMAGDRADWPSARGSLKRAREILGADPDEMLQARIAALAGRIAMETKNPRVAAEAFDRQADLLRSTGRSRALGAVLARAGEAHAALGRHEVAADRLYCAARCAAAWGRSETARNWANAALAAARRADDDVIVRLVESLLSEIPCQDQNTILK